MSIGLARTSASCKASAGGRWRSTGRRQRSWQYCMLALLMISADQQCSPRRAGSQTGLQSLPRYHKETGKSEISGSLTCIGRQRSVASQYCTQWFLLELLEDMILFVLKHKTRTKVYPFLGRFNFLLNSVQLHKTHFVQNIKMIKSF